MNNWNVALNVAGSRERDGISVYMPIDQDGPFKIAQGQNGEPNLLNNTQLLRVAHDSPTLRFKFITAHNFTDYDNGDDTIENLGLSVNQLTQNI